MDTDMEENPQSPDVENETMNVSIEPRITNRAHGGVRTDKTRFIRPVERQRMRPWLIDHLDQNDIPGLVWQERSEMIFRISWKHAANQCFNMQKDTNLFERWAIHTGRHQDSDHKRWKANFRCALNSLPDVTEMKEQGVKKGNNAFKVYRFLDEKEAKLSKDGKPRKKKEPPEYKEDSTLVKFKEGFVMSCDSGEGTSSDGLGASVSSIPNLHQLVPSGVDMLLEADSQEKLQPISGMDNLQEILAAATASLAAGGDAVALEKISIEQLSRLGEVSKMKLDIRQSDRKRRKKEVSGILNVFLCNWCEKVFPTKVDLFQHFLIIHQDKLLSGEEYGTRKHTQPTEKLQQEIEDLEKKVLGFTQESYQNESEEVIEDGQVVDLSSNNSMTSQEVYIEDQVLDLSVAGALAKHPQPQPDVALDLSMSTSKQKTGQKNATSKMVQKRRRSNASDRDYSNKFGNYGLAGAPRTKRQLSLLLKRKEEEEEKARKHAEAQHSMEDLVHAEILISLKSGSKEENETESMELENGIEKVETEEKKSTIKNEKMGNVLNETDKNDGTKIGGDVNEEKIDDKTEVVEEEAASLANVVYLELNDGSKVAVYKQVDIPLVVQEKNDPEVEGKNNIPVVVDSFVETENVNIIQSDLDGSSGKPYKCALCPQRFEDPTELLTHVSVHKTEYKCSVCTKVMTDKDVYLNHIESHLPAGKHGQICEVCNVHFSTVEELQKHIKSHESGTKLFKCGKCGKTYLTVKECVNCKVCLQAKGKEKQAEKRDTNLPLVDIKVEVTDPGKIIGGGDEIVNEKGAAGAIEAAVKVSDPDWKDSLKEKIVNTGQKNLKGEPAITPVASSDNLTGIINADNTNKKGIDSDKVENTSRKCSTQESFELPMDCLEEDSEEVIQKNVRNDVVDGANSGRIQENVKAGIKVFPQKESSLKGMDNNILISESVEENFTSMNNNDVQYTIIKNDTCTAKKEFLSVRKSNRDETFKIEKKLRETVFEKEPSTCQENTECEENWIKHKQSHKETIEDKVKKNVFHCGICDLKLHIDDVESHLKTHRPSEPRKSSNEEMKEEDRTCVICKETIPVKSFYTHWKSHSVYDLSKAQNLKLGQRTEAGRTGAEKGKMPFVCNLCSLNFATFADLKLHVENHLGPRISVSGTKTEIKKETADVLESTNINKDRGKKRKESEKRITGKRPKGKKFKMNSKALKGKGEHLTVKKKKEDLKDFELKASPTITAALKSGPKFSLTSLTKERASKHCAEQSSQSRPIGHSSGAKVVQLDKGPLLVLKNNVVKREEYKGEYKVLKRKTTVNLEAISPKKQKSTNDNMSDLDCSEDRLLCNSVDNGIKESNVNTVGGYTQNERTPQPQVIKSEPIESDNFSSSEKVSSTVVNDKSYVGTNANPATLHRLQEKILLVKEGGVKVSRQILRSVPATVLTNHQQLLSSARSMTCQTESEVKELMLQVEKSSVGCALTGELNDCSEEQPHCISAGDVTKESNVNKLGACTQNVRNQQPQVTKSESIDSENFRTPDKALSTVINDKSNVGTNAKSATLHRLQQKILLVKEGGVKVSSAVPVTVLTNHQQLLSIGRPITCQTTGKVKEQLLQVNESSVECPLIREVQPTIEGLVKGKNIPTVSVQVSSHSAKQEPVLGVQSAGTSLSLVKPSSDTKSPSSTVVLSASPQAYILSVSSSSPVNAVSHIPVVIPQSSMTYIQSTALPNSVLQAHSTGTRANVVVSSSNLTSASQSISLVGSVQNLTRYTTGMPIMSSISKQTLANVTSINTVPSNFSTSLNVTQHQQQKHINISKTVINRVNKPSIVNKPALSPVLITQRGLQQAVPGTAKFPFTNIIYAPQTNNQTRDSMKAIDTTKPSSYQLVWLPVSQPVPQNDIKAPPIVSETVSKPQSFHNLSLENTVLGAKLRASNIQPLNQSRVDQSNSVLPSSKEFFFQSITQSSDAIISSPDGTSSKEKSSLALKASSNHALPRTDGVKLVSSKPSVQFIAGKSENELCLVCAICKQLLNNVEEMSTHVCKISCVSPSTKSEMSSLKEKKSGTLSDSTENKVNLEPRFIRRISPLKGTTLTTHSSKIPLTLSTLPSPTRSATMISAVSMTPSRGKGVTSLVRDIPKLQVNEVDNVALLSSSTYDVDLPELSQKSQDSYSLPPEPFEPKLKEFIRKTKESEGYESFTLGDGTAESEPGDGFKETMQSKDNINNFSDENGKTNSRVDQLISLYPCVICNRTYTLEGFRKHAKRHMTEADVGEKGVSNDKVPARVGEEHCTQEDSSTKIEKKAMESSRKSDVYRCYFCFITCDDEKSLSQHYTRSHPSMTDYLCPADNCAQIFFEVKDSDMHYAFKHQHECRFCLQRFRTYVEFQAHIVQHYKNRLLRYFLCVKCRTHFSNKKAFYRHCRTVSSKCPKTYLEKHINCQQCRCCSINFTSKACLKLHFKKKFYHSVYFRCCICREVISNETEVFLHMSGHSFFEDENISFCHICCIIFPYKTVLSHHLSSADHKRAETLHQRLLDNYGQVLKKDEISKMPVDDVKRINQDIRNEINSKDGQKVLDSKLNEKSENLKEYKVCKGKRSQNLFPCDHCNVCFKSLFRLKQHRVISHIKIQPQKKKLAYTGRKLQNYCKRKGRKSIFCEFCCKIFQHINDLRKHINISHKEKVFLACKNPDCEMTFNSLFDYEGHVCKNLAKGKGVADMSCTMVDAGQPSLKSMKEYMLQYYVEDFKELLDKVAGTVESVQEHLGDHFACKYCDKRLHSCEQLKFHLINQHTDKLAQCVDCLEYFFHQNTLLEHRRDCAVKGFSDEDFHTKKKLLGCDVCFKSFIYIFGLAKFLRDLKFLPDKFKSSGSKCYSRKGVFDLKFEGEFGIEESSLVPFYNARKFVCISCKNEYCNAEDFYICMKSRLITESNKMNEDGSEITDDSAGSADVGLDDDSMPLFENSKIDLKNVFFCNECESIVCYEDGGICLASLKHPCSGSNTLI